jgi:hypothetical protein
MLKNVTGQKIAVFAFDTTTGAAKTGDAANITVYVSKDWGTVTVLGDTSAAEMDSTNAKGWYLFDLTQSETNADALLFSGKSSTSNVSIVGSIVFTTPPFFSTLSVDSSGRVDVIKIAGTTQTARDIGASVLLSSGTGTGQISLSSGTVTVGTNNDKTGYALTSGERNSIADATLDRDMSTGTDSGSTTVRTMRQALRFLRNRWAISGTTLTVYKEDDSTASWSGILTTTPGADPVTGDDPAGP